MIAWRDNAPGPGWRIRLLRPPVKFVARLERERKPGFSPHARPAPHFRHSASSRALRPSSRAMDARKRANGSNAGFCNGPVLVNPFSRHPLAGNLLLYGIGAEAVALCGT